jgi:hypothetical protein
MRFVWMVVAVVVCSCAVGAEQRVKLVADFEEAGDVRAWDIKNKSGQIVADHATHGKTCLKISGNEYLFYYRVPRDWSGYDSLDIDLFVEGDSPVNGSILVADEAWQKKGSTYWNRHNGSFALKPGANTISIPVDGLYRGEAGSRNNDIKSNIDPTKIIRLDIGFSTKDAKAAVYMDYMRLVKEDRPEGIWAYDFGPASQTLFPGFTPISNATVHGRDGNKAGINVALGPNSARDDTFPTRLYQDFVAMNDMVFAVDLPNGDYHIWLMYDDLGYWGGEQASFKRRWVESGGKAVWEENRGEEGLTNYLYRFENVEPRPGDSLWEMYVRPLFTPKQFDVKVSDGMMRLKFRSDGKMACKVAAIIVYARSNQTQAAKWVREVEERNRKEFEARAVYLGKAKALDVPAEAKARGYWLGFPGLEDAIGFEDAPGPRGMLNRSAAQGQRVSMTFAIRPARDLGGVNLSLTDLVGPRGKIPATEVEIRYVQQSAHRGFGSIAYSIGPERLRRIEGSGLKLEKDLTRQFWLTAHVPENTPPGMYLGEFSLEIGNTPLKIPVRVNVLPFKLDEPDFDMAFYGTHIPSEVLNERGDAAWKELFQTIREAGMNTVLGGPSVRFLGLDAGGRPMLDFEALDRYMKLLKEAGFSRTIDGYGGPGLSGLHDGYVIGETGRAWEKKTGKTMGELIKIVWTAIREHGEKEQWLPIRFCMTDEPRVLDQVAPQVELAKLYRENAPWVNIGGSYSVNWKGNDPFEQKVQELFATFKWNAMNLHGQIDIDKAKEFGSALYIYNQGRSRYSWGAYQWAEMHKGIKGRMQWHLLALHGYQFFDLDGREPDTAMINWGRKEIIPTLALVQAREGVDDFKYAVTLWNLATAKKGTEAGREAVEWLEKVSRDIGVDQNQRPAGFMGDEEFREGCIARIEKLRKGN